MIEISAEFGKMLRASVSESVRRLAHSSAASIKCSRLQGKVAVITASTDGIGFSIARRLAQEGAKVMISSRKEANVKKAVDQLLGEGLQVAGTVCHVAKQSDRKRLFEETKEQFGGLDVLVSNAAVNPAVGAVVDCPEEVWDKIFDINVKSTYLLIQESLPFIKQSKSGSIIIVSSLAGYQPFELLGAYSVSKTALLGLCKAAATDLAKDGIRVNCIAPGIIKTKFSSPLYESDFAEKEALSLIPMRRIGTPDEMGGVAAFLASDDASYVTGECIVAAGGMKSRL